jgi:hypothetical protein
VKIFLNHITCWEIHKHHKENTQALTGASKEVCVKVNRENEEYVAVLSPDCRERS